MGARTQIRGSVRRAWLFRFRRDYGAGPVHLAGHLVAFAIILFAFDRALSAGGVVKLLMLYICFVIAHDLIFLPIYAGVDRLMRRALTRLSLPRRTGLSMVNYVRAPALISALLLIIYGPLILGLADSRYFALSGHHLEHYLRNWLLITGALFLGSGVIYLLRVSHLQRRRKTAPAESD
jgi:hypothetical protein